MTSPNVPATHRLPSSKRGEQCRKDLRKQVNQVRKKGKEISKKANLA